MSDAVPSAASVASPSEACPFSHLLSDWLSHIFSHLPTDSLLVHVRCVSSHWSRVSRTIEAVSSCTLVRWRDSSSEEKEERHDAHSSSMRESIGYLDFELMKYNKTNTEQSMYEINHFTHLSTLLLDYYLSSLVLGDTSNLSKSYSSLDLKKMRHLKKLRVYNKAMQQKFWQRMRGQLPKLTQLILAGKPLAPSQISSSSTDACDSSSSNDNNPSLPHPLSNLSWLLEFDTLTSLHFSSWTRDLPQQLVDLATLPRLRTLRLEIYRDDSSSQDSFVEIIDLITNLPHLTDLTIQTHDLNDESAELVGSDAYIANAMVMQQMRGVIQSNVALPSLPSESLTYTFDPRPCCGFTHLTSFHLLSPQDFFHRHQISSTSSPHENLEEFAQLMKHTKKLELAIGREEEEQQEQQQQQVVDGQEQQNSELNNNPILRFIFFISYLPSSSSLRDLTLSLHLPASLEMLCLSFESQSSPMPLLTSFSLTLVPTRDFLIRLYIEDGEYEAQWDLSLSTLLPRILLHLTSLEELHLNGMSQRMDWRKLFDSFVKGVRTLKKDKKEGDGDDGGGDENTEKNSEEKTESENLNRESEKLEERKKSTEASSAAAAAVTTPVKLSTKGMTKQQRKQMKKVATMPPVVESAASSLPAAASDPSPPPPPPPPSHPLTPIPPHLHLRSFTLSYDLIQPIYRRDGKYNYAPPLFEQRLNAFFQLLGIVMPNLTFLEWNLKTRRTTIEQPSDMILKKEADENVLPSSLLKQHPHPYPFPHLHQLRLSPAVTPELLSPSLRRLQKLEILEMNVGSSKDMMVLMEEEKAGKNGASSSSASKLKTSKTVPPAIPLPSLRHLIVRTPRTGKPKKERKVARDWGYLEKFTQRGVVVEMAHNAMYV